MTFEQALNKALVEQKRYIRRKDWQSGVGMEVSKTHLELQHITTCKIKGPKPYEYLKDDWVAEDFGF